MASNELRKEARPRQRQWRPKSTTGCITCKIRRVKCDEAKPACDRCTSTGRACDGYAQSRSVSPNTGQLFRLPKQAQLALRVSPRSLSPGVLFSSNDEHRSFYYFEKEAISQLCRFDDSPFWQYELLQAGHAQPAIRYAIAALGALHESFATGSTSHIPDDSNDRLLQFALQQSNRAIQEMLNAPVTSDRYASKMTLITSSILFQDIACLQGHQEEALRHIQSGVKLLKEIDDDIEQSPKRDVHPISLPSLRSVMIGLDLQARSMLNDEDLVKWAPPTSHCKLSGPTQPLGFSSLGEVRTYFQALMNETLSFLGGLSVLKNPDFAQVGRTLGQLRQRYQLGSEALDAYIEHAESPQAALVMRIVRSQAEYFVRDPVPGCDPIFGPFRDTSFDARVYFRDLLGLVDQLKALPVSQSVSPYYSSSLVMVPALFLTATRSPDRSVQREAINHMIDHPWREGIWDGILAGKIAMERMVLEEACVQEQADTLDLDLEALAQDASLVPTDLKILDVDITYTGSRSARVEYKNEWMRKHGERGWIRHIAW
ncbi:hypothetical protein K491DRAFT_609566 [Lophiostoma macrostomum CBS 122681]|uniref:Zn(2)-C6 fungal-type domain-containing protein n=1 Tax=Lophiostoma macrostomum CBS 122681 TaxID=1314788 RepID=A0A6A6SR93_9PLEO|nr:hypothetical protein K491DRAFT_609566 [Lophiostoma macrostomum CBS 122681]